jgi:chromosome segregation ATPase
MDVREVSQNEALANCQGKLEVPTEKEKEALGAMKSIKERVRGLKKRLTALKASEHDETTGEILELEKELAHLKVDWDKCEKRRQKAAKERMILLGHEKD